MKETVQLPEPAYTLIKRLEDRGYFCRVYAEPEELAAAILTIWRHMTNLGMHYLAKWRDSTVGELMDAAHGFGAHRKFMDEDRMPTAKEVAEWACEQLNYDIGDPDEQWDALSVMQSAVNRARRDKAWEVE